MRSLLEYSQLIKKHYEGPLRIYGAGIGAYYLARDILNNHKKFTVECFMVSDESVNISGCFGIPVKSFDECQQGKEIPVIVGTLEWLHEEIVHLLVQYGFENIFVLKDEEYLKIRQKNPDTDADVLFSAHKALIAEQQLLLNQQQMIFNMQLMAEKLREIEIKLRKNPILFEKNGAFHNESYVKDFKILRENEEFDNMVNALVKNLDTESRCEVYRIIHRLHQLCDEKEIYLTKDEEQYTEEMREALDNETFELGNRIVCGKYILPGGIHIEPAVFYYKNGIEQLRYKEKVGKKAIIDAGGYIGDSSLIFSENFDGKIYCFEFEKNNLLSIEDVIEWNGLKNVIPVDMALTDQTGEMEVFIGTVSNCSYNSINNFGRGLEYKKEKVPCITLDDFVYENNLEVGLIKADVEGCEKQLILGAVNTIKEQHPTLMISIYHSIDDLFTIKPLIESIYSEYDMKIFRPVLPYSFIEETLLICEPKC